MRVLPCVYRLAYIYRGRLAIRFDRQYLMRVMQLDPKHTSILSRIANIQAELLKETARQTIPQLTNQDAIVEIGRLAGTLGAEPGSRVQQYNLLEQPRSIAERLHESGQRLLADLSQVPVTDIISTPSWIPDVPEEPVEVETGHQYLTVTAPIELPEATAKLVEQILVTEPELLLEMLLRGFPPYGLPLQPSHFQLGRSSVIDVSNIQLIFQDSKYYLVFLARTTDGHAFDGQLIWKLEYDPATRLLRLIQSGIGTHPVPLVDSANFFVAPTVFSAAIETLAVRLGVLVNLRTEHPDLSNAQLLAMKDQLTQRNIMRFIRERDADLATLLDALDRLDSLAFLPAVLRRYLTGANMKAPSPASDQSK
jgi:hypothetical protein